MRSINIVLCCGAILLCMSSTAAQGIIDPQLSARMAASTGPYEVIVTFKDRANVERLNTLAVNYLPMIILPMAGAVLTADQINRVRSWETVESIYLNEQLQYFNNTSGAITGAHYVQSTLGISGRDQTIVVLDSGIDGAHPDLQFGPKVIQNVKIVGDLGLTGTTAFIEGVLNTDNTSGHGTHVAGTVGGTGAASTADARDPYYYRGVAPQSRLVGLGAGETLLILHALIAFDYAIANRERYSVDVITNSWGNTSSQFDPNNPINRATYEAYRRGIVVTFAAGNEGPNDNTMSSYAISPWVIGVAAGTKTKELADFSSRGETADPYEHPDITAPGVSITSTRAPGTPVGALGPVVDVNHPEYTGYYHTISGTSMATPFVAGTVALLLEANPELSPDQVEEIVTATADPMPSYGFHQVGAGYVNVRKAVEQALATAGKRTKFLAGDTKWSSQGAWVEAQESEAKLAYTGPWETVSSSNASGGAYKIGSVIGKGKKSTQRPYMRLVFFGRSIKIEYPVGPAGGSAEVVIDGVSKGTLSFFGPEQTFGQRTAFGGLANTHHTVELRGLTGEIYVDAILVDGDLFPANTEFTEAVETFTGTMGPSVEGIPETRLIPFEVGSSTIQINAELSWTGGVDIDLYLLDPQHSSVASSASLDNPEGLTYWVSTPGTYTYKLVGYATLIADYTLTSRQVKAVQTSTGASIAGQKAPVQSSPVVDGFALYQNYPNPFNPQTTISYSLAADAFVSLRVFDLLGRDVATLVQERQSAGAYTTMFDGHHMPTGVYYFKLDIILGNGIRYSRTNRMCLVR